MPENSFFVRGRNKGNERKVILQSELVLVGKAPTKQKRIKIKVQMMLSGQKTTGMPEWMEHAFEFVAKNHDPVTPQIDLRGFDLEFSADNLFGPKTVKTTKAQLRGFFVQEVGEAENADVVLQFLVYAPFSGRLHSWIGQMAGEEIWMKFEQMEEQEDEGEGDLELSGEPEEEPEQEEEGGGDDEA